MGGRRRGETGIWSVLLKLSLFCCCNLKACANTWAMTTVARGSWGGDFYVTGDCGAVDAALQPYPTTDTWPVAGRNNSRGHGYALPPNTSFGSAGLDSDCTGGGVSRASGTAADQVAALQRLFRTEFRLGRFDPLGASPFDALGWQDLGTKAHKELAREACQQSIVLLKNADGALPLARGRRGMRVAMIGPTWEVKEGGYSGHGSGGKYTLPAPDAIAGYLGDATQPHPTVTPGCSDSACEDVAGFAAAVAAAEAADVVLIAVGIDDSFEGENGDYRALSGVISLPGHQLSLVTAVAAAAKHPITVVVTGSSVDLAPLKVHPRVGAIIWRGYCGEAANQATADVLFGAVSPSGRLTQTFYPQSFLTEWKSGIDPYTGAKNVPRNASYFDHHVRPNATTGNPGRTHRFYTGNPVYKFGDGMGYTTFGYKLVSEAVANVSVAAVRKYASEATEQHMFIRRRIQGAAANGARNGAGAGNSSSSSIASSSSSSSAVVAHRVRLTVTNTGNVASAHSVLCFVVAPTAGLQGAPLRTLVDFEKVYLVPGGTAEVAFNLVLHDFTLTALEGGKHAVEGQWTVHIGDVHTAVVVG